MKRASDPRADLSAGLLGLGMVAASVVLVGKVYGDQAGLWGVWGYDTVLHLLMGFAVATVQYQVAAGAGTWRRTARLWAMSVVFIVVVGWEIHQHPTGIDAYRVLVDTLTDMAAGFTGAGGGLWLTGAWTRPEGRR